MHYIHVSAREDTPALWLYAPALDGTGSVGRLCWLTLMQVRLWRASRYAHQGP